MNTDEWNNISERFEHALSLPRAEQEAYLAELERTESVAVVREIRALLQADQDSAGFMQTNALRQAARELADGEQAIRMDVPYGHYRILKKLGAGGMGEVYLALHEPLGRQAALKFLPQVFMQDATHRERFEREARAASALNHPNILTVYEIGEAHGRVFIATEYIEGPTLRDKVNARSLTTEEILSITEQVGAALNAAHSAGLIHRDIKPENIMLRPDGIVKLLDFGLAQLVTGDEVERSHRSYGTDETYGADDSEDSNDNQTPIRPIRPIRPISPIAPILGTPRYLSPEQARGAALDQRTDLWSLGVTLYEMLTAQTPYTSEEALSALRDERPVVLSSVPVAFQPVLQKALAKPLATRYQNVDALLADLQRIRRKPPSRALRRWLIAASVLLVLLAAVWLRPRPTSSQPEKLYWEMSEAEQQSFLKEAALRVAQSLGANAKSHSAEQIALIREHLEKYIKRRNSLATAPGQESPKAVYARATVYAPFIIEAFRARDLPPMLGLYIAMNETEYHPCTESAVGAKGLFSFMPQTAELYGLQLKPQDERCNPRRIADAAARYVNDLTQIFGKDSDALTLMMVAYNCGEGCVSERVSQMKARNLKPLNIWTLLASPSISLNQESRSYVPRFFAEAIMGENPQRFGLEIQPLSLYEVVR